MTSITLRVRIIYDEDGVIISGCGYFNNIILKGENIFDAKKKFMNALEDILQIKETLKIKEPPLGVKEKYDTIKMEIKQIEGKMYRQVYKSTAATDHLVKIIKAKSELEK